MVVLGTGILLMMSQIAVGYASTPAHKYEVTALNNGLRAHAAVDDVQFSGKSKGMPLGKRLWDSGSRWAKKVGLPVLAFVGLNQAMAQTQLGDGAVAPVKTIPEREVTEAHNAFFHYVATQVPKNETRMCFEQAIKDQHGQDSIHVWKFNVLDSLGEERYDGKWVWQKVAPDNENYLIMAKDPDGNVIGASNQSNPLDPQANEANDEYVHFFNNSLISPAHLGDVREVSESVYSLKVEKDLQKKQEEEKRKLKIKRVGYPVPSQSTATQKPAAGAKRVSHPSTHAHKNQKVQGGRLYKRA